MENSTLQEIGDYLEELFESKLFQEGCPNGLQVEGRSRVRSAATAVSASLKTIGLAVERGVDLLIVHHGLFWRGDSYRITGAKKRKIELLMQSRTSLAAFHLPMDAHRSLGNNWGAALALGWSSLEPFGEFQGCTIGVKGRFPECSREEFQRSLELYYGHAAHAAPGGKERVSSAALVSGGAHWKIADAALEGVDCYITGSFDEPIWHLAMEERINFFALGHSATEKIGPKLLSSHLQEACSLPCAFIDEFNPF